MLRIILTLRSLNYLLWLAASLCLPSLAHAIIITSPGNNISITSGETVTFVADSQGVLCGSFTWDFENAASAQTINLGIGETDLSTTATLTGTGAVNVTLSAVGGTCETVPAPDSIIINVNTNNLPTATIDTPAGNQSIQTGDTLNFTGSGSDPDGNLPLSYRWNFSDQSPDVAVEDPGNVTFGSAGSFPITFTVIDSLGLENEATITVTVADNIAPTASIDSPVTNPTIQTGQSINFAGSGADSDGNTPLSFAWDFDGGASNSTAEDPGLVVFNTAGTFNVTYTVTDSRGLASQQQTVTVTVIQNIAPTATIDTPATNQSIQTGQSVNFTATGSDSDGNTPLTFDWDFGGGATNVSVEDPGDVAFNTAGTYVVTLTATDTLGLSSNDTVTITVADNIAPTATIDTPTANQSIQTGQSVNFTATGNDPDGNIPLTFAWDFGGGATNVTVEDPGNIAFNTAGTFVVTLTVTDSQGLLGTDTVTITVADNVAPAAEIDTPSANVSIQTGDSVNFSGSGIDSDGNLPLSFAWDFGGGATNVSVEDPGDVAFNTAGTFVVTLTVTDSQGLSSDSNSVTVTVADNIAPTATIDTPASIVTIAPGDSINLSGSGSDSDGNLPLIYNWNIGSGLFTSTLEDPGVVVLNTLGTFEITLTVTDSRGAQGTDTQTVIVSDNNAPTASIDTPSEQVNIFSGGSVVFTGTGADADGNLPLTYLWDFNGGAANVTEEDPGEIFFNEPGTYNVTFTVTDSLGASGSDTQTIVVGSAEGSEVETALEQVASTPNEESVSGAVVDLCLDAGSDSALQELCGTLATAAVNGDAGVAEALDQITMDEVSASIDSTIRAANITSNNIGQRFSTLRLGGSGIQTSGLAFNVQGYNIPVGTLLDGYSFQSGGSAGEEVDLGRWGVFANGSVSIGNKDASNNEAGYDFDTKGLTFGADYRLKPNQIVGAALSFGSMDNEIDQGGGDLDGDNYALILYGTQFTDDYYVDTSITYGHSDFDQTRNIRYTLGGTSVDQALKSDFNGSNLSITAGGGYQLNHGAFSFGPEVRIEYMKFDIDAFQERVVGGGTSGWALAIDKQTEELFNTNISAYIDYAASFTWGVLVPSAKLDWIHEFQGDNRIVNGRFVGDSTGSGFVIETDVQDKDFFSLALGTSAQLPEGKSAFFNYQTLLGKTDTEQHSFNFGFRWDF